MKKTIGIIGAGQAGQRIAVALDKFDDVEIKGIVDPVNGRNVLTGADSEFRIAGADFFDDDDQMLRAHNYDGLIIAADPISAFREKPTALSRNGIQVPVLWERPVGFKANHPKAIFREAAIPSQSVISFSRFGYTPKILKSIQDEKSLGEIIDFDVYGTLNCGLKDKKWRHAEAEVPLPVHFLDIAFELVEQIGCGTITEVSSTCTHANRNGVDYDEKWEVRVTTSSGVTGRVIGVQYVGETEFLYPCRSIRVIGTQGALVSNLGSTSLIAADGSVKKLNIDSVEQDARITESVTSLQKFFRKIDGYHADTPCRGEATALSECLRAWVDFLVNDDQRFLKSLTSDADAERFMKIALAAVDSSSTGQSVGVA